MPAYVLCAEDATGEWMPVGVYETREEMITEAKELDRGVLNCIAEDIFEKTLQYPVKLTVVQCVCGSPLETAFVRQVN